MLAHLEKTPFQKKGAGQLDHQRHHFIEELEVLVHGFFRCN